MIKTVNLAHANKYKWTEGIKDVLCPTYSFFFFFRSDKPNGDQF